MDHWKNKLPGFVIDINYEKLIDNPKEQIHYLLKSCNLTWNDQCLKFYKNKRPITPSSDTQVRKDVYKTSIDSWKSYKKYMNDFFQKLPN